MARPSREGLTGLEDATIILQIYHKIIPHYLVTIIMHRQVVLGSVDHILPPPGDDDQVIEHIQIESETEPDENPEEEPEYDNDEEEEEVKDDHEEEPEEEILGGDTRDDY